jgi:hypothetical protein
MAKMIRSLAVQVLLLATAARLLRAAPCEVGGSVTDPQGKLVAGATVTLTARDSAAAATATADGSGQFHFLGVAPGAYSLSAGAAGFVAVSKDVDIAAGQGSFALQFVKVAAQSDSVVITAKVVEPTVDLRNGEAFNRTLFTRDDQVFEQLNAGIDVGQHEGGGKSLEVRRFGFNLDHGGVNGGLKVLLDDVQQNQGSQGHGQGYLGSLKALSPELIQEVDIVNGPFRAEYGDFSGLGVVHIRQRESLPDEFTARVEGGNFDTARGFLAFSPASPRADAYIAYEGAYTDGPFLNPERYRRDNINGNFTRDVSHDRKLGFRIIDGRNDFYSSGQIPLDLVAAGELDRFGYLDPSDGGRVRLATVSAYFSQSFSNGDALKLDAFLGRSLFDLFSNFTFFLNDPINGDAIQQHDSRLQQGANAQYTHVHKFLGATATLVAGANFHDNEINVGLYPRDGRTPTGVTTRSFLHVTNEAAYAQETVSFFQGKLIAGAGLRYDDFRFGIDDVITPTNSGVEYAGRWQAKGNLAYTPWRTTPLTFTLNYGRGINSADAAPWRSIRSSRAWRRPISTRLARRRTTAATVSASTRS